jgi:hypothetical protein
MALLTHNWRFDTAIDGLTVSSIAICDACGVSRIGAGSTPPGLDGDCPRRPAPGTMTKVVDAVAGFLQRFGGLVALTASAIGLILLAAPNLTPATTRAIEITDVSIENGVSYGQYVNRRPVVRANNGGGNVGGCRSIPEAEYQPKVSPGAPGVVSDFAWTAKGMRNHCVELTSSLLDGDSGVVQKELPLTGTMDSDTQISDSGTFLLWVDGAAMASQAKYIIRVEFFDGTRADGVRLAYKDSKPFCYPTACPEASPSTTAATTQ